MHTHLSKVSINKKFDKICQLHYKIFIFTPFFHGFLLLPQRKMLPDKKVRHSNDENERNFAARGTLTLEVPTLPDLNDKQLGEQANKTITSSIVYNIGDLKWQLELRKEIDDNYSLFAKCNENYAENFWFCNAKFTAYLKEEGGEQTEINSTDPIYTFYGNNSLLIAGPINLPKKCPFSLIVEAKLLRVKAKMFALDTNIQVKMANGTALVALNKQGLAVVSSYFNNLFFAQWREMDKEEFIIQEDDDPNFDIGTFRLMIYAALSLGWMVPELLELFKEGSRMFDILKLSFKYDIPPLVEYCQDQLILNVKTYPPNLKMLELADELNLTKLINHCTAKFDPSEFMKNIAQSVEIRSRLGKSTIEKLDEECAKKMEKNKADWAHNRESKNRKTFNAEQKRVLEDKFVLTQYPDVYVYSLLATKTGLSEKSISTWFKNKRAKYRRQRRLGQ